MRFLFFLIFLFSTVYAYRVEVIKWGNRDTFYGFLKENSLPLTIYYSLPPKIKKKLRFIRAGESIYILRDDNKIKQALLPLDEKNQLQIIYKNGTYMTKIVPIEYQKEKKRATITINNYLSYDVYKATGLKSLTYEIISIFKDRVNFRLLPKNTKIELIYEVKKRYSKVKNIKILYAKISNYKYTINAFYNPYDRRYYDENGKSLRGMFLAAPLHYKRISSYFGRRFHPILHKWRMHDGIDYVNKIGTPIKSTADGKVVFKGWIKGYGRVLKIAHRDGYITLYAHLHRFKRGIYVGKWVRQGEVIAYLGNSGLSTGPHLHYGVMKNGRWINPLSLKKSAKVTLRGYERKKFLAYIKKFQQNNNIALK